MIRALWFFAQLALVAGAAIWLLTRDGAVDIAWAEYTMSVQLGVFLLAFAMLVIAFMALFQIVSFVAGLPTRFRRRKSQKDNEKGYRALTRGFVAIAAGDAKKAAQFAKDVRRLIPDERGLPLLLEAQAARLRGDEVLARHTFEELLQDKDAAFFGVRGLLKSALDSGDTIAALEYARAAQTHNPKSGWIVKSVYDLEVQNHQWHAALETLVRLRKTADMDIVKLDRDEIALLLLLSDEDQVAGRDDAALKKAERAVKLDPAFAPAVIHLCEIYQRQGKERKIEKLLERAWKLVPHPELAVWWDKVAPANKSDDMGRRLRWMEKLAEWAPQNADGHLSAAMVAMEDGLWGEARVHLDRAEDIRATAGVFRLRAKWEEEHRRDMAVAKGWVERAANAAPDAVWYDTQTGTVYDNWSPIALPHGSFNTIVWGLPTLGAAGPALIAKDWQDPLLIERA